MQRLWTISLLGFVACCSLLPCKGYSQKNEHHAVGYFTDGPVQGLTYRSPTRSGTTDNKGKFEYSVGETVTFYVGDFILGSAPGSKRMTPAHLVTVLADGFMGRKMPIAAGDTKKVTNRAVINMARFVQSLDRDGEIENGIVIAPSTSKIVSKYSGRINFDQDEESFTMDSNVAALFKELNLGLRNPSQARNHLRRTLYGIHKTTDVKIPTRDGSYLLANVFLPVYSGGAEKYPVVMSLGAYGKMFGGHGCICDQEDAMKAEELEDTYFANVGPYSQEHFETVNTVHFVPKGYALIRIDGRGVCNTPGFYKQFSLQEAKDYYDAIEWAGKQPWSNGRVGINGSSYYGMVAFNVASLQPPSLKAMLPIDGDVDPYRDHIYSGGGLFNLFEHVANVCCVGGEEYEFNDGPDKCSALDWVSMAKANPFYDPALYGPEGSINMLADLSKMTVPFFTHANVQSGIHLRGTSEAVVHAASKAKKFALLHETGGMHGMGQFTKEYLDFFDYWLKGIDNGVMDEPPVQVQILTGYPGYYWLYENEWPIARTQYTKFYLDAAPVSWNDGQRTDFMKMSNSPPTVEGWRSYSGDVKPDGPCYASGVSFVTDPMPEDTVIAGYSKLVAYVSSTTKDMAVHAAVRAVDEENREVLYLTTPSTPILGHYAPFQKGELKVSHRKLDPVKSTDYRPYHTHLEVDYQPLNPGEIVEIQVEIWPGTALIKKGWRIRLDVQPIPGCEGGTLVDIDQSYQAGSSNTIYTGPEHLSYIQLPIIPAR
jgi:predicted acyl esterase